MRMKNEIQKNKISVFRSKFYFIRVFLAFTLVFGLLPVGGSLLAFGETQDKLDDSAGSGLVSSEQSPPDDDLAGLSDGENSSGGGAFSEPSLEGVEVDAVTPLGSENLSLESDEVSPLATTKLVINSTTNGLGPALLASALTKAGYTEDEINAADTLKITGTQTGMTLGDKTATSIDYLNEHPNIKIIDLSEFTGTFGVSFLRNAESITTVILSSAIKLLPTSTFSGCTSLVTLGGISGTPGAIDFLSLPNITALNQAVFSGASSVETVILSNSITSLPRYAFKDCVSLSALYGKTGVRIEGMIDLDSTAVSSFPVESTATFFDTFAGCPQISAVALGSKITELPSRMFFDCSSLTAVSDTVENAQVLSGQGVVDLSNTAVKKFREGNSTATLAGNPFGGNPWEDTGPKIKTVILGKVTELSSGAFRGMKNLETVAGSTEKAEQGLIDLSQVTSLGRWAFDGCPLVDNVVLGESITEIGYAAFQDCTSLETLSNSVANVKANPGIVDFEKTAVVDLNGGTNAQSGYTFKGCTSVTKVTLGDRISILPRDMFSGAQNINAVAYDIDGLKEGVIDLAATGVKTFYTSSTPLTGGHYNASQFWDSCYSANLITIGNQVSILPYRTFAHAEFASLHAGAGDSDNNFNLAIRETFTKADIFIPQTRTQLMLEGPIFSTPQFGGSTPLLFVRGLIGDAEELSTTVVNPENAQIKDGAENRLRYYYELGVSKAGQGTVVAKKGTNEKGDTSGFIIDDLEAIERTAGNLGENNNYIIENATPQYTLTPALDYEVKSITVDGEAFTNFMPVGGVITLPAVTADTQLHVVFGRAGSATITYDFNDDGVTEDKVFSDCEFGEPTPTIDNPERPGYTFGGWDPEVAATVEDDATYTAQWTPKADTQYKIQFFNQVNGVYSATPTREETRTGTTDTTASATEADKMPSAGYTLDSAAGNIFSGNIAGDGSLILKIYFKQQFTVTFFAIDRFGKVLPEIHTPELISSLDYGHSYGPIAAPSGSGQKRVYVGWKEGMSGIFTEEEIRGIAQSDTEVYLVYGNDHNQDGTEDALVTRRWVVQGEGGELISFSDLEDSFVAEQGDAFSQKATDHLSPDVPEKYTYKGYLVRTDTTPIAGVNPSPGNPSFEVDTAEGDYTVYYVYENEEPASSGESEDENTGTSGKNNASSGKSAPKAGDALPIAMLFFVLSTMFAGVICARFSLREKTVHKA